MPLSLNLQGLTLGNLRIGKTHPKPEVPALEFAPMPGVLPSLFFSPCTVFQAEVGGERLTVYRNFATGSMWGFRRTIARSQSGAVFIVAELAADPGAPEKLLYRFPYVLRSVKMEAKVRVQASQAKLSSGGHGDNSMLSLALAAYLATTPAAPYAVKVVEAWHDRDHMYSVMEYLRDGDLLDCVAASPGTAHCMSESDARLAMVGALRCLSVLHAKGFMHRDISPENIMVDGEGNGILIDFGSALPMTRAEGGAPEPTPTGLPGLAGWQALPPPRVAGPFCKPAYACPWYVWSRPWYGVAYDLYSIGTTLFSVLDGRALYAFPVSSDPAFAALMEADAAAMAAAAAVAATAEGSNTSDAPLPAPSSALLQMLTTWNEGRPAVGRRKLTVECLDLLSRLLRLTPESRPPSAATVLTHPWFTCELGGGAHAPSGADAGLPVLEVLSPHPATPDVEG